MKHPLIQTRSDEEVDKLLGLADQHGCIPELVSYSRPCGSQEAPVQVFKCRAHESGEDCPSVRELGER